MCNPIFAKPYRANQNFLQFRLRRAAILLLFLFACAFSTHQAVAATTYCANSSVTYSPALPSTIYYSKSYASAIPVVVYSGTASWTISGCSGSAIALPTNLQLVTGTVVNAPGLTVAGTGTSGVTAATCTSTSSKYMTSTSSYAGNILTYDGCTYNFPFTISTNSTVSTSSGGSSTAAQLAASLLGIGWLEATIGSFYIGDSTSTTRLAAQGKAITFIPRGCTATVSAQTVTLPTVNLGTINTTGYTPWTSWSFGLDSCTAVSSAVTASVTFAYTELDGTGSSIIAPTGGTATHVGVQVGYNGSALANGTATSLGKMSSATSYTYTLQARYAKASGYTATAGTITGATATYVMTYN